ncbi:CPBP family intramembrane glutamic endopeptidase [Winogradskyella sp.]|uniref:CPBP family intramembrane glutamic endopeptidase n=1 Tax=Winogradskyella sp. TaxID=1883156 RepID=UPI003BAC1A5D
MLGLLVIIVISGLLLHFIEKKNIDVLGITPNKNRWTQFMIGVLVITVIVLTNIVVETLLLRVEWQLRTINNTLIFDAFYYHLKSALTEDLVFRGALLYILIRRIGPTKAIILSAMIFGVYHWFSYGIIGQNAVLMAYVFLITGFTGYVWAFAFYKTKSILMGLGFHVGVNFINACFFESQPYGELIFTEISRIELKDWNWLYFNLFKGIFPSVATLIFLKQYLKFNSKTILRKQNQ